MRKVIAFATPIVIILIAVLAFLSNVDAMSLVSASIWDGLNDPVLMIVVAAYVSVISLMAAQAIGCAASAGDAASRWVAMGASVFMLSAR